MQKSELSNFEKLDQDTWLNIVKNLSNEDISHLCMTTKHIRPLILDNEKFWHLKLENNHIHMLDKSRSNKNSYFYAQRQILSFRKLKSIKKTYQDFITHKGDYYRNLGFFACYFTNSTMSPIAHPVFQVDDLMKTINSSEYNYKSSLNELVSQGYECSSDEKMDLNKHDAVGQKKKIGGITFNNKLDADTLTKLVEPNYPPEWSKTWHSHSYNNNVERVKALLKNYQREGIGRFLDYFTKHHVQKILKIIDFLNKNPKLTDQELVMFLIHNASFSTINLKGKFSKMLNFVFDCLPQAVNKVLDENFQTDFNFN